MVVGAGSQSLLDGQWQVCLPAERRFKIKIQGIGNRVPSWNARLGVLNGLENEKWWFQLMISDVPDEAVSWLDFDLCGTYTLLEKCGTAMGALHKKETLHSKRNEDSHGLFFFLDPIPSGDPKDDSFVFSTSIRRLAYKEFRPITAQLDPS